MPRIKTGADGELYTVKRRPPRWPDVLMDEIVIFRASKQFKDETRQILRHYDDEFPNRSVLIRAAVHRVFQEKFGKKEVVLK